ncbi:MAG: hypothetical protein AAFZ17_17490 [Cyanobacteria bacterium J06650_10]
MKELIHGRWFLCALTVCGACVGGVLLNTPTVMAQTASAEIAPSRSLALLPLESTSFELSGNEMALDAIASDINTQVDINIALSEEVEGLTWEQIPIVRDFIDEDGNMDMSGGALPISVSVSNFMEAYGVVVSTNFKVP